MCGRLFTKPEGAREILALLGLPWMDLPELNNQAPTEHLPFVFVDHGKFVMKQMRWGLHPSFATEPPAWSSLTHNARIETVDTLPAYRNAVRRQRGLVPAAGFVEWRNVGKISEPFYIDCPNQPLAIAGIWDVWNNEVFSFSIITQSADAAFGEIHPRMPLTLDSQQLMRWLDPKENANQLLQELKGHSLPLRFQPIDFAVNNARNKAPVVYANDRPQQSALF
jgi:putative SOS response-associated peptidase YedK